MNVEMSQPLSAGNARVFSVMSIFQLFPESVYGSEFDAANCHKQTPIPCPSGENVIILFQSCNPSMMSFLDFWPTQCRPAGEPDEPK